MCFAKWDFMCIRRVLISGTRSQLYRANLISKVKELKDVAWTGDGRFDSIGHSAKYGVYTMLGTTIMKNVHFELVQVSDFSTTKNIISFSVELCK